MSAHASAPESHGVHGDSFFTTPKSWFGKPPSRLNPLSSTDSLGHNLVRGVVENTTGWAADILNPLWTATKNAGSLLSPSAYRTHGIKNIPKSLGWTLSHVFDAVNNLVWGSTFRWLDHAYRHGITNSVVDITSGTTDRVPVIGKVIGNIVKLANALPAGIIRLFGKAYENSFDTLADWLKSTATVPGKGRHLTTHAIEWGQSGGHH